jgi:hypothetical protein
MSEPWDWPSRADERRRYFERVNRSSHRPSASNDWVSVVRYDRRRYVGDHCPPRLGANSHGVRARWCRVTEYDGGGGNRPRDNGGHQSSCQGHRQAFLRLHCGVTIMSYAHSMTSAPVPMAGAFRLTLAKHSRLAGGLLAGAVAAPCAPSSCSFSLYS